MIHLPDETVAEIERLVDLERELQEEGMPFAEAAERLGVQSRTIDSRVRMGMLEELRTCGPDGTRYVARASVRQAEQRPELMTRRRPKRRGR